MQIRRLGRTDLEVSAIGLGCWGISGEWGAIDHDQAVATLRHAYDLGVTFFDTADTYGRGRSEELVRTALSSCRHQIVIATKGGMNFYEGDKHLDFRPQYIASALERSLVRLGTDYVDLYQLHNPEMHHLTDDVFALLERLREQGKVRYYGVSLNSRMEGLAGLNNRAAASLQVMYNLLDQRAADDVFPWAMERDVGVIARVPLSSGRLAGKFKATHTFAPGDHRGKRPPAWIAEGVEQTERLSFLVREGRTLAQAALQFVLAHPAVSVTIPGAKSPQQVEENVAAAAGSLAAEELAQIRSAAGVTTRTSAP